MLPPPKLELVPFLSLESFNEESHPGFFRTPSADSQGSDSTTFSGYFRRGCHMVDSLFGLRSVALPRQRFTTHEHLPKIKNQDLYRSHIKEIQKCLGRIGKDISDNETALDVKKVFAHKELIFKIDSFYDFLYTHFMFDDWYLNGDHGIEFDAHFQCFLENMDEGKFIELLSAWQFQREFDVSDVQRYGPNTNEPVDFLCSTDLGQFYFDPFTGPLNSHVPLTSSVCKVWAQGAYHKHTTGKGGVNGCYGLFDMTYTTQEELLLLNKEIEILKAEHPETEFLEIRLKVPLVEEIARALTLE